jgi:hypothetical protein
MSTRTLGALATAHGVPILEHLDQQLQIPVLAGLQFQGDIALIPEVSPSGANPIRADAQVPAEGVAVVRGESGGNTHLLVADGPGVLWAPATNLGTDLTLGHLTVPPGSLAYLLHPEHGANGIAPGTYEIRRQREQRDEITLIAD